MRLRATKRGIKSLSKLDRQKRAAAEKALNTFLIDPRSPGLHFEKLPGYRDLHTIRVDVGFGIFLRSTAESDLYEIVDAGPHDRYKRVR